MGNIGLSHHRLVNVIDHNFSLLIHLWLIEERFVSDRVLCLSCKLDNTASGVLVAYKFSLACMLYCYRK